MNGEFFGLLIGFGPFLAAILINVIAINNKIDKYEAKVSRLVEHLDRITKKEIKNDSKKM